MTAVELISRAAEAGVTVAVRGPDRLAIRGRPEAIATLKGEISARKREIIVALLNGQADAIVHAHSLRRGHFLPAPAPCSFHIGYTHEGCRRCRASLAEHYQERDQAAGDH